MDKEKINGYGGSTPDKDILQDCFDFLNSIEIGEPIDASISTEDLISELLFDLNELLISSRKRRKDLTFVLEHSLRRDIMDVNRTSIRRSESLPLDDNLLGYEENKDEKFVIEDLLKFARENASDAVCAIFKLKLDHKFVTSDFKSVGKYYGIVESTLRKQFHKFTSDHEETISNIIMGV